MQLKPDFPPAYPNTHALFRKGSDYNFKLITGFDIPKNPHYFFTSGLFVCCLFYLFFNKLICLILSSYNLFLADSKLGWITAQARSRGTLKPWVCTFFCLTITFEEHSRYCNSLAETIVDNCNSIYCFDLYPLYGL